MFFLFSILLWTPSFLAERVFAQSSSPFSYNGGIPLRMPDGCPTGSVFGQVTYQQNCCGGNQTFVKNTNGSFCCPDGECIGLMLNIFQLDYREFEVTNNKYCLDNDCSEDVENGPKVRKTNLFYYYAKSTTNKTTVR